MKQLLYRVLLADDDADERFLSETALKSALPPRSSIHMVKSGNEAISYLAGDGIFADRAQFPFPSLIISDLEMADGDGFDVLEFLQANPEWMSNYLLRLQR